MYNYLKNFGEIVNNGYGTVIMNVILEPFL